MKLLIADDQTSLHRFLNKMIDWSALGISEVRHAYTGKEAAQLAESYRPDLVVMDIRMPEWNGIESLRRMRELPKRPKTVILSAYEQFEYAREALRLNVAQYLLKPIDAGELTTTLRELVREARAEAREAARGELAKAAGGQLTGEGLSALREALGALGIARCAAATVLACASADGAPLSPPELPPLDGLEAFPLLSREAGGERVVVLGLRAETDDEAALRLCEAALTEWRRLQPQVIRSIGLSSSTDALERLPRLIADSRLSALQSFYAGAGVYLHTEEPFAADEASAAVREAAQSLADKARLGYAPEALREGVGRWLDMLREQRVMPDEACEQARQLLSALARTRDGGACADAPSLEALKQSCGRFDELAAQVRACLDGMLPAGEDGASRQRDVIRRIKRYVDSRFEADLSLQTVADRFALDKYRLSREFKRMFGENYWHYVTRVRLEHGAAFLRETAWTNSVIAERTGYADESHFSRAFKKHYGISPKEFRAGVRPPSAGGERND